MNNIQLSKKIMFRVYALYVLRRVCHPRVLRAAFFLFSLAALSAIVSIPNVWTNMTQASNSLFYIGFAFMNTQLVVKLLFACAVAGVLFLLSDIAKTISLVLRKFSY